MRRRFARERRREVELPKPTADDACYITLECGRHRREHSRTPIAHEALDFLSQFLQRDSQSRWGHLLLLPVGACGNHPEIGPTIIVRVSILVINMLSIALANDALACE